MSPTGQKPAGHYLKPGELFFGETATMVSTLLGSCVAVTMFSPRCRVGAICHVLLPSRREEHHCPGSCDEGARYVDCALRLMLDWFTQRGIVRSEIEVKAFGGSDMFAVKGEESRSLTVGRQNLELALHLIKKAGLRLYASDLGGPSGRKIFFSTHTGEVLLKRLNKSQRKV
ncbi:MAG: chemotaxis protein CheD [Desulfobacteraceae bacterium]|nr:chemotaxis protein CheD [Desulfobacteraceae bacterium]